MSIERAGPSNARDATSIVNSSFNTVIRNAEGSTNNTYHISNMVTYKIDKQSRKIQKKDLPTIKERNDQQEVLPNKLLTIEDKNELILNRIWKYLKIRDKFNCTLVCKRFNKFIIEMDYFCLHLDQNWPLFKTLPTFKRSYKTLLIKEHYFENFSPTLQRMLQQLSGSVIRITLHRVATDVITFRDILDELPLLESIELFEIQFQGFKASFVGTPKFGRLRNLKINVRRASLVTWFSNSATANALLDIFSYAPKVTSLSMYGINVEVKRFNKFLVQFIDKLESLSIINCCIKYNNSDDYNIFDCFLHLRSLSLYCSDEMLFKVLTSHILYSLTDLDVFFKSKEREKVCSFLQNYFLVKEIELNQLLEYDSQETKEPIVTYTECPYTDDLIVKYYHFHNCTYKFNTYYHSKCETIPLTNLRSNLMTNKNKFAFFSIQVREDVIGFKPLKDFNIFDYLSIES